MGATHGRWLERVVSRTLLLLLVALVAAVSGAVPGDRADAAPKNPPGDPPGNNGTVKISRTDPADDPNYDEKKNEPMGEDCNFWLRFFDFDEGQLADITFAAHPPTGGKDPITDYGAPPPGGFNDPGPGVVISDDPAGGGQDEDAVIGYDLTDYVRDLNRHEKHGYHIKLTTTIKNADGSAVPGGVKHKVFWIDCAPAAATTLRISKAVEGSEKGPFGFELNCSHRPLNKTFTLGAGEKLDVTNVPPGTVCAVTETDSKNATGPPTIVEDPPHGKADDGEVKATAGKATIVKFTNKFPGTTGGTPAPPDNDLRPPAGGPAGDTGSTAGQTDVAGTTATQTNTVLGATETRPDVAGTAELPRTGGDPTPLAATGLWTLAAGGLALLAGRRLRRS
jgi:hypothetical protein